MQSILQTEKACYLSGYSGSGLDKHHIFFGANRKISEDNGFWVWLRHDLHIAGSSYATPHNSRNIDLYLKRECQRVYETSHTREEFIGLIGYHILNI